jgi:hypothetical protein
MVPVTLHSRRKIRLIEGNAKWRHLTILTCKETLWQVFIRVFRLETGANFLSTFSHAGIFNPALGYVLSCVPLSYSLWFNSPPPFPV